jgi:hypothetical protein
MDLHAGQIQALRSVDHMTALPSSPSTSESSLAMGPRCRLADLGRVKLAGA